MRSLFVRAVWISLGHPAAKIKSTDLLRLDRYSPADRNSFSVERQYRLELRAAI